jgi:hypothetical protein
LFQSSTPYPNLSAQQQILPPAGLICVYKIVERLYNLLGISRKGKHGYSI